MITMEVEGIDDVLKSFDKIDFFFKRGVSEGINEGLKLLKMRASDNLDLSSLHVYPHDDKSQSINANWRIASPYERDPTILGGTTTDVLTGVLYNISRHACIVGSSSTVSLDDKNQDNICDINENKTVLSKDGKIHKVNRLISDRLSNLKKNNLIRVKCEHSYMKNGLLLTDDHLVLTYNPKMKYAYWEEIGKLKIGDYIIHKIKQPYNKGTRRIGICKYCGAQFKTYGNKQIYCNQFCYHNDTDHGRTRGKHLVMPESWKLNHIGEKNPSWRGGVSKLPYGPDWTKLLREKIKERDKYSCQTCGMIDENLVIHHKDGDKFNNDENNLITLCNVCHGKLHWSRDCELISIDWNKFKPEKITKLERIDAKEEFKRHNRYKMIKLFDISVEGENSFVSNGIVVHNSYVELGTGRSLNPAGKDPGSPDVKVLSSLRSGHKKLFTADVIRPKSAQVLKFADVGGEFIYSKYVEGQPPKHYLRQAMLMSGKEIKDAIRYYSWDRFKDIESNVRF